MNVPRFDEPRLTVPISEALDDIGLDLGEQRPLPAFCDPQASLVAGPCDEPLIRIGHDEIIVLESYKSAGWPSAHNECLCRESVHVALVAASGHLPEHFGLAVFDAWRPLALQYELYRAAAADPSIPEWLVAEPSDEPLAPPPHVSGGSIDLTLTVNGAPVELGTGFDDATERAFARSLENEPGPEREGRRMLYWAMRSAGFVVFRDEWWHFELGTRRWAAITGNQARFDAASLTAKATSGVTDA